jgi:hypothetical protein
MLDALRNGWSISAEERQAMVAKTSGRKKQASSEQEPGASD